MLKAKVVLFCAGLILWINITQGPVSWKLLSLLMILSMEKTMVAKVISKLNF